MDRRTDGRLTLGWTQKQIQEGQCGGHRRDHTWSAGPPTRVEPIWPLSSRRPLFSPQLSGLCARFPRPARPRSCASGLFLLIDASHYARATAARESHGPSARSTQYHDDSARYASQSATRPCDSSFRACPDNHRARFGFFDSDPVAVPFAAARAGQLRCLGGRNCRRAALHSPSTTALRLGPRPRVAVLARVAHEPVRERLQVDRRRCDCQG